MQFKNLTVYSPQFEAHNLSEAEILGSAVWLWMHSEMHRGAPLTALSSLLLPVIKTGQYMLAFENEQPIAYVAWAALNDIKEADYLKSAQLLNHVGDWQSGERYWLTDYIAPFGHAHRIRQLLTHRLYPSRCWRSLYHKGNDKGLRVVEWHGAAARAQEARLWFDEHPVSWPT